VEVSTKLPCRHQGPGLGADNGTSSWHRIVVEHL
jgi:hypothetical protein